MRVSQKHEITVVVLLQAVYTETQDLECPFTHASGCQQDCQGRKGLKDFPQSRFTIVQIVEVLVIIIHKVSLDLHFCRNRSRMALYFS